MAIPPPPPPGPPPPPVFKMGNPVASSGGGGGGGDMRNALLESIQKGTKLKKAVTVDKSGPAVAGRVAGSGGASSVKSSNNVNSSSSSGSLSSNGRPGGGLTAGAPAVPPAMSNGGPKLGGIFEGLSSMPKLKPVNRGTNNAAPVNRSPPRGAAPRDEPSPPPGPPPVSSAQNGGGGGALDFNAELTKHLTLKRQKQQQPQVNATEANLKMNRGPPPQPPPLKNTSPDPPVSSGVNGRPEANSSSLFPNSNSSSNSSHSNSSSTSIQKSQPPSLTKPTVSSALDGGPRTLSRDESLAAPQSYSSSISTIQFSAVANKSSLFTNTNGLNNDISPSSPSIGSSGSSSSQTPTDGSAAEPRWMNMTLKTTTTMIVAKPQPNHGKPNLAPKPPGMQNTPPPPPPVQPNGLGLPSAKVSRHHSMKSPRSPPVAPPGPGGPVFPSQNHFGTLRGPPQFQSSEAINSGLNGRLIGRPTVAPPPRPPANRPPPPPTRSVSNSNLPNMPLSTPTTNTLNASSANNVNALKEQLKHHIGMPGGGSMSNVSSSAVIPPPPPPAMMNEKVVNGVVIPPPLPPHRTCPAPPPPNVNRQISNNSISSGGGPPVPPQRHSSIRSTVGTTSTSTTISSSTPQQLPVQQKIMQPNGSVPNSVNRIIVDLEAKFANRFHNVTDFSKPAPFLNCDKHYPSRNTRAKNVTTENRKQRAPPPPRDPSSFQRQTTTPPPTRCQPSASQQMDLGYESLLSQPGIIQLSDGKLFASESSSC